MPDKQEPFANRIEGTPVGLRIRQLRLAKGWTLAELARRAGTSAPSLHRYECGWGRFQVATLRRIAGALDARLEIRLVPRSGSRRPGRPAGREMIRLLSSLFWDRDLTAKDLESFPDWVIGRALMFGNLEQARAVRRYFGDRALREAVGARGVDERTRAYWLLVLEGGDDAPESAQP